MWYRRLMLTVFVLAAMCALPKSHAATVTLVDELGNKQQVTFTCPIADGSDWRFDPAKLQAHRVEYIQASMRYFNEMCGTEWPEPPPTACARFARPDPMSYGNYSVIYSTVPMAAMSEALLHHELCHTQGWVHGKHY